eukprot:scaffold142834_cov26-Tisochrysis_lutea.AAC.1
MLHRRVEGPSQRMRARGSGDPMAQVNGADKPPPPPRSTGHVEHRVTALWFACDHESARSVRALLAAGAKISASALKRAVSASSPACLDLLLASSPSACALEAALEYALGACTPDTVRRLLEAGATGGELEVLHKRTKDVEATVRLLAEHRGGIHALLTPKLEALALQNARLLEALLRAGAPVPALRGEDGKPRVLSANALRVLLRAWGGVRDPRELLPCLPVAPEECARLLLDLASGGGDGDAAREQRRRLVAEQCEVPTSVETVRVLLEAGADAARMLERAPPDR